MSSSAVGEAVGHIPCLDEEPQEDIYYTWLKDYLATLEGKEARLEYYAWLEYELTRLRSRKES
jgi:hypothetical protein